MEKTVRICNRPVRFKASGSIIYRYKAQFGREFLDDVMKLETFHTEYKYTKSDLETMRNILWVLAKTADENIPDPLFWSESFGVFPVDEIYRQVSDILVANLQTKTHINSGKIIGGRTPSTEEFVAGLILKGFTIADMDRLTFGMLIDVSHAWNAIKQGRDLDKEERREEQLRNIRPIIEKRYKDGEITKERYLQYLASIGEEG